MKNYYLFKSGKIFGPINEVKLAAMSKAGELLAYSWVIEEKNQQWIPIDPIPTENPFVKTKELLGERTITGSFMILKNPLMGLVKGIHSYGLELFIDQAQAQKSKVTGLKSNSQIQLNLVDETNEQWINADMVFQSAEPKEDGVLLRFGWSASPVQI